MIPRATYRLQFRNGMDFERAIGIVPYLARLGVSHFYASPIFSATKGSTHGYDIVDQNSIDPELGGAEGLARLSAALKKAGIGLILDIVPNHMAASLENGWWRSVVEWGSESPYAGHFDIDWSRQLTLPVLGRSYGEALVAGELSVRLDAENGGVALAYFDTCLPLHPSTYADVLADCGHALADAIATRATAAGAAEAGELHKQISELLEDRSAASELQALLDERSREAAYIDGIHQSQPWRLLHWKDAKRQLSYRRFFEVTGLVGLRVEDESVFDDVHALILQMVRSGMVDGLRVDHIDGLADPTGYLARLRREIGDDVYLVVEKILGQGEQLPGEWPISGTTGYEFITAMSQLLVDPAGVSRLEQAYRAAAGDTADLERQRGDAKRLIVYEDFAGELSRLAGLASDASAEQATYSAEGMSEPIGELICAFPVYRTYGDRHGMPAQDRDLLLEVRERALAERPQLDGRAVDWVMRLLLGDIPQSSAKIAGEFRTRFQQLTGPVMAKAVEDTLFYRWNAMIALNEVGGDPGHLDASIEHFHRWVQGRRPQFAHGLLATATHDTKRGEDARARLYALAEMPGGWSASVANWRSMHSEHVCEISDDLAPEPETEWLIYQALAGIWPAGRGAVSAATLEHVAQRMMSYIEKAMREAKLKTGWTEPNEPYEAAVKAYVSKLLAPENAAFHKQFSSVLRPVFHAGAVNALAQTLVKFTAPGVPDIYQGAEMSDFSLVDPDNRREVDFQLLSRELDRFDSDALTEDDLLSGRAKLTLVARCLALRRSNPELFERGEYREVAVVGARKEQVLAFERLWGGHAALIVVTRFPLRRGHLPTGPESSAVWGDTRIQASNLRSQSPMRNLLTGEVHDGARDLALGDALGLWPVALIVRQD